MKTILAFVFFLSPSILSASMVTGWDARALVMQICPDELQRYEALKSSDDVEQYWRGGSGVAAETDHDQSVAIRAILGVAVLDRHAIRVVGEAAKEQPETAQSAIENASNSKQLVECVISHLENLDVKSVTILLGWIDCVLPVHTALNKAHDADTLNGDQFDKIINAAFKDKTYCRSFFD